MNKYEFLFPRVFPPKCDQHWLVYYYRGDNKVYSLPICWIIIILSSCDTLAQPHNLIVYNYIHFLYFGVSTSHLSPTIFIDTPCLMNCEVKINELHRTIGCRKENRAKCLSFINYIFWMRLIRATKDLSTITYQLNKLCLPCRNNV